MNKNWVLTIISPNANNSIHCNSVGATQTKEATVKERMHPILLLMRSIWNGGSLELSFLIRMFSKLKHIVAPKAKRTPIEMSSPLVLKEF